jgi:hypothetical protein
VDPFHDIVVYRFNIFNEVLAVVFVQTLLVYSKEEHMQWFDRQGAFDWGWVPISLLAIYLIIHVTYQIFD